MKQKNTDFKAKKKQFFNKKFLITIILILFIGIFSISYLQFLKIQSKNSKNQEILNLLNRGVTSFKESYGFYPEKLKELDEKSIIKPLNLILNKENEKYFYYNKTNTGFILRKL